MLIHSMDEGKLASGLTTLNNQRHLHHQGNTEIVVYNTETQSSSASSQHGKVNLCQLRGEKPAQSAKDGQRDTIHITLRYDTET